MIRHAWISTHADVTQKRQCVLAGVSRTTVYVKRKPVVLVESDEVLKRLIDEEYTRHPFYGSRKMVVYLGRCGHLVNRKRVQRLMRCMSLAGMAPGPNTSAAHPLHKVYPYLLRGVPVVRANQVWSTDITYVRLARGFAYLVAVIDWYSRRVLSWRMTNSMDGRGRAYDNIFVERLWRSVKHEDIYLNGYATMGELLVGLTKYFAFYNTERPHQSLDNQTPQEVHQTSSGGGAMIVDKYRSQERLPVALCSSGTAAGEVRIEIEPARQKAKTGAAPTSCEKLSAT